MFDSSVHMSNAIQINWMSSPCASPSNFYITCFVYQPICKYFILKIFLSRVANAKF